MHKKKKSTIRINKKIDIFKSHQCIAYLAFMFTCLLFLIKFYMITNFITSILHPCIWISVLQFIIVSNTNNTSHRTSVSIKHFTLKMHYYYAISLSAKTYLFKISTQNFINKKKIIITNDTFFTQQCTTQKFIIWRLFVWSRSRLQKFQLFFSLFFFSF